MEIRKTSAKTNKNLFSKVQKQQIEENIRGNIENSTLGPSCPQTPRTLFGLITVDWNGTANFSTWTGRSRNESDAVQNYSLGMQFGGWWEPSDCRPTVKVAILIPYRKRPQQLSLFLNHMIPVFQRQLLSFRIFIVEQVGTVTFNKGAIYNIGFHETLAFGDFDCYIFHDVDLLAENDLNYYGCPTSPRHMSVAIDKFFYKLPYPNIFGGVQAFTKKDYILTNGYSNQYWGWGGEDDSLYNRITASGLLLTRPSFVIGRYKMNQEHHFRSDHGNLRNKVLPKKAAREKDKEGLNTISSLKYSVRTREELLCTFICIDLAKT